MKKDFKKVNKIICQVLFLVILIAFFIFSFIFLSKDEKMYSGGTYEFNDKILSINSSKIFRSDFSKSIKLYGNVERIYEDIDEVVVPKSMVLNCKVGAIIEKAEDIANNYEYNYSKGRVVDIIEYDDVKIVRIDKASNYYAKLLLADSNSEVLKNILNGDLEITVNNSFHNLNVELLGVNYDYKSCQYILEFQICQLDVHTYNSMSIIGTIIIKNYKHAVCLNVSALRDLTDDYFAVVDRIVSVENNTPILEELKFKIIDTAGSNIIIDAEKYIGEEFVVYGYYHTIDF